MLVIPCSQNYLKDYLERNIKDINTNDIAIIRISSDILYTLPEEDNIEMIEFDFADIFRILHSFNLPIESFHFLLYYINIKSYQRWKIK